MITLLFNGHHLVYETTKQLTQHVISVPLKSGPVKY